VEAWSNGFWTITQEELERFAALVAVAKLNPLTDEEILKVYDDMLNELMYQNYGNRLTVLFARAIERAHGIGNEE